VGESVGTGVGEASSVGNGVPDAEGANVSVATRTLEQPAASAATRQAASIRRKMRMDRKVIVSLRNETD
jgi:hypothetical protein